MSIDREPSTCEHCGERAPPDHRFCTRACLLCEHESLSEDGCNNICLAPLPDPKPDDREAIAAARARPAPARRARGTPRAK